MLKQKKVTDLVSIFIGVSFGVVVLCGVFTALESCVYGRLLLPLFFISALPVIFSLGVFILNILLKKARKSKITAQQVLYKENTYSLYLETSNYFKIALQNKMLTRTEILEFKTMLNQALEGNLKQYRGWKFKNDAHEIYTKLKSHHISETDMEALRDYIMPYAVAVSVSSIVNPTTQPSTQYGHLRVVK